MRLGPVSWQCLNFQILIRRPNYFPKYNFFYKIRLINARPEKVQRVIKRFCAAFHLNLTDCISTFK